MENDSFFEWRRGVARREDEIAALAFAASRNNAGERGGAAGYAGASVTPYEKSLHVWRQLWRVLERSPSWFRSWTREIRCFTYRRI